MYTVFQKNNTDIEQYIFIAHQPILVIFDRSIVYCLNKIFAKYYQNWLICVQVIMCYISVVFLDTVYVCDICLQRYDAVGWVAGRASGL